MEEHTSLDSLTIVETVSSTHSVPLSWAIVLFATFLIVGFLIGRKSEVLTKNRSRFSREKKKTKAQVVDYDNVINSAFEARNYAKTLKKKCHPDLFAGNNSKMKIAEALHQEVEEKSRNLNELRLLEKEITVKLYDR